MARCRPEAGPAYQLDRGRFGVAGESELTTHAVFDGSRDIGILFEELFGVFASLTQALAAIREPRPAFFDDPFFDRKIEQVASPRDAFAIHDVELGFAKRRRHFVLD